MGHLYSIANWCFCHHNDKNAFLFHHHDFWWLNFASVICAKDISWARACYEQRSGGWGIRFIHYCSDLYLVIMRKSCLSAYSEAVVASDKTDTDVGRDGHDHGHLEFHQDPQTDQIWSEVSLSPSDSFTQLDSNLSQLITVVYLWIWPPLAPKL